MFKLPRSLGKMRAAMTIERSTGLILKAVAVTLTLVIAGCSAPPVKPPAPTPGTAADYRYLQDYLSWYIPKQMKKHGVPGASIALVDDRGILWAEGFGYADRERRVRATADTVYQVGSISKTVTATAVMQLAAQGKLDLDRPITAYVPEFSMKSRWSSAKPPTLRALITHHGGLPSFHFKGFFSDQPLLDLVEQLHVEYLVHPPETVSQYSNLGPNLLGLAIERVTGELFSAHMRTALFEPLGMRDSAFTLNPQQAPTLARGYIKGKPATFVTVRDVPAGALLSSVRDLGRFMQLMLGEGAFGGRRLLPQATVAAIFQPQYPNLPLDFGQRFGLGWVLSGIDIAGAGPAVWHSGGTNTFFSQMILLPQKKLGVVVLTNADTARTLAAEWAEVTLKLALEARDGIVQPPPAAPRPVVPVASEILDSYAGDYSLMGALAHIRRKDGRLQMQVLGNTLDLVPLSDREFRAEYRLFGLIPISIPFPPIEFTEVGGRRFALLRDRVINVAEKVPAYPIPEAWRRRVGTYRVANPDKDYLVDLDYCRMLIDNDRLLLELEISGLDDRRVQVVVVPLSDNEAYVFGLGRNIGDVTRAEPGRDRMWYSGYAFDRVPDRKN